MVWEIISLILLTICLALACFIMGVVCIGLFKFRTALTRIHITAKCDTLITLLVVAGCMIATGFNLASAKMAVLVVFMWLTGPVSVHVIGETEIITNYEGLKEYNEVPDNDMY